jgi:phospholipid/cholesterol/gamma-HCH transport system substrate-binding protein
VSRKTEVQVGVTVLFSIVILFAALAWFKEISFSSSKRIWKVAFPETGGLATSSEVLVNGLRKGEVRSMRLVGDHVEVELNLAKEIVLTSDCTVAIRNVGLMGERVIAVDLRSTGRVYSPSELVSGTYERGLGEFMGRLSGTVDALAEISVPLRRLAETMAKDENLGSAVRNFSHTSEELRLTVSENRAALHAAITDFAAVSKSTRSLVSDREGQLRQALDDFSAAAEKMDRLSSRLDSLRAVLQNVGDRVDRGEGTLGKLIQDDRLYTELNESILSLKDLIQDVKAHPKKYFRISVF